MFWGWNIEARHIWYPALCSRIRRLRNLEIRLWGKCCYRWKWLGPAFLLERILYIISSKFMRNCDLNYNEYIPIASWTHNKTSKNFIFKLWLLRRKKYCRMNNSLKSRPFYTIHRKWQTQSIYRCTTFLAETPKKNTEIEWSEQS